MTYLSRTSADHLVLLHRDKARHNEQCERLRVYLAGAQFQVTTDQKTLEAIFSNSNSKPPVRIKDGVHTYNSSTSKLNTDQGRTTQQTMCQDTQYVHQKMRLNKRSRSRRRKFCMPLSEETYQNHSRSKKSEQLP